MKPRTREEIGALFDQLTQKDSLTYKIATARKPNVAVPYDGSRLVENGLKANRLYMDDLEEATESAKIVRRINTNVNWSYLLARGTLQRGDGRVPMVGIAEVHPKWFKRRLWPKKGSRMRDAYSSRDQWIAWTALCVLAAILGIVVVVVR